MLHFLEASDIAGQASQAATSRAEKMEQTWNAKPCFHRGPQSDAEDSNIESCHEGSQLSIHSCLLLPSKNSGHLAE